MPDKRQNRRPKTKNCDKISILGGSSKGQATSQNDSNTPVQSTSADSPQDVAAKFESELVWCIEQLQIGISNDKTATKKAQEAVKILKILENPKAPLIKKRQAMRAAFGDYRKKMEDDEKKYSTNAKKMKIEAVSSPDQVKSVVYKKSHSSLGGKSNSMANTELCKTGAINPKPESNSDRDSETNRTECEGHCKDATNQTLSDFHFVKSNNLFKFDFEIDSSASAENNVAKSDGAAGVDGCNQPEPSTNYYKLETSKDKFAFNFFDTKNS